MTTEAFTRQDFETALDEIADGRFVNSLGYIEGELAYEVKLDDHSAVMIRSSIRQSGTAAPNGEDSIRAWLVEPDQHKPLGAKVARWVTRQAGWQGRLSDTIKTLIKWREQAGDCPTCGMPKKIFVSHTEKNPNRPFAKCMNCDSGFEWLDQAERKPARATSAAPKEVERPELIAARDQFRASLHRAIAEGSTDIRPITFGGGSMDFLTKTPSNAITIPAERAPDTNFKPSPYQQAIFDFVRTDTRNAVVEAVAGSGKTTTIVRALSFVPEGQSVAFLAFNRHIAKALKEKAPEHVFVATVHSLGFRNMRKAFGQGLKVEDDKLYMLAKRLWPNRNTNLLHETIFDNIATIQRLVDLCKGTLKEPHAANLEYLCDRFGLTTNGSEKEVFAAVKRLFDESLRVIESQKVIDYEDMIYLSATGQVPCEKFDVLFVDEAQDLNAAQIELVLRSARRIIAVGDRYQSIYGFRGADTTAIPSLIERLNASRLPLSVCYRCARAEVVMAKRIVSQIEWREDAPDGLIQSIQALGNVRAGDLILCRTNAPLVRPCFELIANKIKAAIRGRDIGSGLVQLLEKTAKHVHGEDVPTVFAALREYTQNESFKLIAAGKTTRAQALEDQFETLVALSEDCLTIKDITDKIRLVFSDDQQAVTFSSIHRAKGDQAERVFILKPELLPHPMARRPWEQDQETNLQYVAVTRAITELYFVGAIPEALQ